MPKAESVYQFKIVLRDVSPMVWRRILVRSDTTIAELHHIIQVVMDWDNDFLHRFHIHGKDYGVADVGGISFADNPHEVRLERFRLRPDEHFLYEYNFFDSWTFDVRLEQVLPLEPKQSYPRCTGGQRAAPPEDCGGPLAYAEHPPDFWPQSAVDDLHTVSEMMKRLLDVYEDERSDSPAKPLRVCDVVDTEVLAEALERLKERDRLERGTLDRRGINAALHAQSLM